MGRTDKVRVLGFKHDDLVNTGVYGGNHSKAGISFEFMDCLGSHNMNGTESANSTNVNGWAATEMRTYLESTEVRGKLSNNSYIKQVKKQYIKTYNNVNSNNNYSNDYLWLLAASEIWNNGYRSGAYGEAITTEGPQYQYYKGIWWLRSPIYNNSKSFCCVRTSGNRYGNNDIATCTALGVAPGFNI